MMVSGMWAKKRNDSHSPLTEIQNESDNTILSSIRDSAHNSASAEITREEH